jgi:hypothetical protein
MNKQPSPPAVAVRLSLATALAQDTAGHCLHCTPVNFHPLSYTNAMRWLRALLFSRFSRNSASSAAAEPVAAVAQGLQVVAEGIDPMIEYVHDGEG